MLHKHTLHYILALWAKITLKNVRKVLNFALEIGKLTAINRKKTYQSRIFFNDKIACFTIAGVSDISKTFV